jgi:uncharacterized repeat protein (TIGR01451 family)
MRFVLIVLVVAFPAQAQMPGRVYSSTGAAFGGIVGFDPGGSNFVSWTANTFDNSPCGTEPVSKSSHPTVAVDGRIAFASGRDELLKGLPWPTSRIEIMNADGTGRQVLTTRDGAMLGDGSVAGDLYPAISPDGTKVAFISRRNDTTLAGIWSVFIVSTDGSDLRQITFPEIDPTLGTTWGPVYSVAWNPDSTQLAFRGQRLSTTAVDTNLHFHMVVGIVDATGSNEVIVAPLDSTGQSTSIDWSPNGRYLVADYGGEAQGAAERRLFIFDLVAGTATQLMSSATGPVNGGQGAIRFSPDSQKLIFTRYHAPTTLATMNRDGSGVTIISDNFPIAGGEPLWWKPGEPIPTPARFELAPDPVTLLTGGAAVQLTPTLYDAASNVIVKAGTAWTIDCCSCCTPRFDNTGRLTPGTHPWYYTCQFSAQNAGLSDTITVINNPLAGDLSLTKLVSPPVVIVSNDLTYTLTISNKGPIAVSSVWLYDELARGLALVSMPTNCALSGSTVYCNFDSLAGETSTNTTIVVMPTVVGPITNAASVIAAELDPDYSSNEATNVVVAIPATPPAPHDFALLSIKPPKNINLKAATPALTKRVKVQIQNLSPQNEIIPTLDALGEVVSVTLSNLHTDCAPPRAVLVPGPPNVVPKTLKSKGKVNVFFNVTFTTNCLPDAAKGVGHQDFSYTALVDRAALDGNADTVPSNDVCPRAPAGGYKGCGGKTAAGTLGADVLTDVFMK